MAGQNKVLGTGVDLGRADFFARVLICNLTIIMECDRWRDGVER